MMIRLKRVYDAPAKADGYRVLVDRVWPRGMSKERAKLDLWFKEIAPSGELRKWFGHDPAKWEEFSKRYQNELDANPKLAEFTAKVAGHSSVTLLYSAADTEHNNAVALRDYLLGRL